MLGTGDGELNMNNDAGHTRVSEALQRTRPWLNSLLSPGQFANLELKHLLRILIGLWLCQSCDREINHSDKDLHDLAKVVSSRIARQSREGVFDPFVYDPKLLLFCYCILLQYGLESTSLRNFAIEVASAFNTSKRVNRLRFVGERVILSHLNYCSSSEETPILEFKQVGGGLLSLLEAGKDELRMICSNISAATQFGVRRLHGEDGVEETLAVGLPVLLLQELRDYDLELGSSLLRAVCYLGSRTEQAEQSVCHAVNFLVSQQQVDGRIGYLTIESQHLDTRTSGHFSADTELFLPISVSCIWALSESQGFRMFGRLPPLKDACD
jgi:hypothetical protein